MSQTLDEARAAAAQAIVLSAQEYLGKTVPQWNQITGSMLIGHFQLQQPPWQNATAMLAPLFAFIYEVQRAAQPFVDQALNAGDIADAYAASDAFDPSVVPPPKIDVWGTKYPEN
jgi:hypothetical protein